MAIPASERVDETVAYRRIRAILQREEIPFMVGGGHAVAFYGQRRPTKDLDFLVLKEDAERLVGILERDRFFIRRSDPRWLYQALLGDVLFDFIFGSCTPNGVVAVTREWLDQARSMAFAGETFPVAAPEELIGIKILAQHENRPDWWDAETILRDRRDQMDWRRIVRVSGIDPVKTLAFLLFLDARHPGEGWYPRWVLDRFWSQAGSALGVAADTITPEPEPTGQ